MNNKPLLVLAIISICGLLACAETGSAESLKPDRSDRDGLIEFGVPAGWIAADDGKRRNLHFKRVDPAENQAMIGVTASLQPSSLSNDELWENLKGKHEIQGHTLIQEKVNTMKDFDVREGTFGAEVRGQSVVYHNVFLLTDTLWIDLNLNAAEDVYDLYLSDFQAIVGSVHALKSSD